MRVSDYWSLRLHRQNVRLERLWLKLRKLGLYLSRFLRVLLQVLLFVLQHGATLPPIVWLALVACLWLSVTTARPFLRTSYAYIGEREARYYTSCNYLGLKGFIVTGGPNCPIVMMQDEGVSDAR